MNQTADDSFVKPLPKKDESTVETLAAKEKQKEQNVKGHNILQEFMQEGKAKKDKPFGAPGHGS